MVFSSDNRFLFLPDLGTDKIRIYKFNELQDHPLQAAQIPFIKTEVGSRQRHFTFHPNGKFSYYIEELSVTIDVFKYANGKLDKIQRIATHTDQFKDNFRSADIHISPDGKFLYASNRGVENNIAIFPIKNDSQTGLLTKVGTDIKVASPSFIVIRQYE